MRSRANRSVTLRVRVTPDEFIQLKTDFLKTSCQSLGQYSRIILLGKIPTVFHRNRSLDECMYELIQLRQVLHQLIENFHQAFPHLQTLAPCSPVERCILCHESVQKQI
jgi:hypothetical protein